MHPAQVAKPALGRGLGNLMPAEQKAQTPSQPTLPGMISPGMAALLRAEKSATGEIPEKPGGQLTNDCHLPRALLLTVRISLVAADILLCGLVLGWALKHGLPSGFWENALCVAALILGAWLSVLAFWLD